MNLEFKLSPFAPRLDTSSHWTPFEHNVHQIRGYCDADLYACLAVWAKATWRAHAFLGMATWLKQVWRLWQGQIRSAATWVYVRQGLVCGFISVHPRHHIAGLFVDPMQQGTGIGSQLLSVVDEAVELESVDVYSLNVTARQFYEHRGFQVMDVFPLDGDGAPYALMRMTRRHSNRPRHTEFTRSIA